MRRFSAVLLLIGLAAAAVWWGAGRAAGPSIQISQPGAYIGQSSPLQVSITSPGGRLVAVDVGIEQGGKRLPVFSLDERAQGGGTSNGVVVSRRIGKQELPELQPGPARLVVRATRPVLYDIRRVTSVATRDLQVRLEPPRVEVLSTFHYINQGGAELVVYRATPADVESGVQVGDVSYPGFPGAGVGIKSDPSVRVAFFALLHDQDANAPITVFARDPAGNQTATPLDHRVFPKPFARSRIQLDEKFLQRVVPAIAATTPDLQLPAGPEDLLASFLKINGDLRRRNGQTLVELSKKTSKEMLWKEPFQPLGNAKVGAKFADSRTYVYQGKDVDHQVHLGFDLAVTEHIPVAAANHGIVLHAGDLGIYGNCIVVDHGLGVQSLYGHLSSIGVKVGQTVEKGQIMGRSGMTGLAAGDHLHFTMLLDGHPVNPVEWWDLKWMQDRVFRKIAAAGAGGN